MPLPDPASDPQTLLRDIDRYIDEARGMLARGETIMLGGLDDAVEALCKRVMELPVDQARPFADQFEVTRGKLDQLQLEMVEEKERVAAEIGASKQRQKAVHAYRPAGDKK